MPEQDTPKWSEFATNLIEEYESEELPVVKDKETGEEFKQEEGKQLKNSKGKILEDKDIETLMDENGNIRTEERGIGLSRFLGDILRGGILDSVGNAERDSEEYRAQLTWVLTKWQDKINP